MVMGTITDKMGPVLKRIYEPDADPKWVLCMGRARLGRILSRVSRDAGDRRIIPVDVYILRLSPTPKRFCKPC